MSKARKVGIPPRPAMERYTVEVWTSETEELFEISHFDNIEYSWARFKDCLSAYSSGHMVILSGKTWNAEIEIASELID